MNKVEDILKETDCLTERQMQLYLEGKLSESDMHDVEMHLASCEFCAEAMEGLSEMEHPEELSVVVRQVRSRFKQLLHTHKVSGKRKKYYINLAVIVVIIIAILLLAFFAVQFTMNGEHRNAPSALPQQQTEQGIP